MTSTWILFLISVFAGCLGSILGLGGGIILIPALTLGYGVHIRYAVGASIVSVIATSSGAAASYVRDRVTNIRLAIYLEMATTLGALCGVMISSRIHSQWIFVLFAFSLLQSAYFMWRRSEGARAQKLIPHPWSEKLRFNSSFVDPSIKQEIEYKVAQVPRGFLYMWVAGVLSGLLGIGSGILKVVAMDQAMGLPIKVSSATSNFMIGVTAAASAGAYFLKGDILPELAAPVALGVLVGASAGSRIMMHLPAKRIRKLFVIVLVVVAVQMLLKGLKG
jgi:uncharacterized membrane protein YfcA